MLPLEAMKAKVGQILVARVLNVVKSQASAAKAHNADDDDDADDDAADADKGQQKPLKTVYLSVRPSETVSPSSFSSPASSSSTAGSKAGGADADADADANANAEEEESDEVAASILLAKRKTIKTVAAGPARISAIVNNVSPQDKTVWLDISPHLNGIMRGKDISDKQVHSYTQPDIYGYIEVYMYISI